jgi:hypothetical protein
MSASCIVMTGEGGVSAPVLERAATNMETVLLLIPNNPNNLGTDLFWRLTMQETPQTPEPSSNPPEESSNPLAKMHKELIQELRAMGFTVEETGPSRTGTSTVSFVPARRTTTPPPAD